MTSPSIPLEELFRLTFTGPVIRISTDPGNIPEVKWVTSSIQDVQPGDLFLVRSVDISEEMINQIQDHGITTMLIIGDFQEAPERLPKKMVVFSVLDDQDINVTARLLLTILINQRAALIEQGSRIYMQLSQLAAEGAGLEGVSRILVDISGKGVLVQDKRGRILAEQPSSALLLIWPDILAQLVALDSLPPSMRDRKRAGLEAEILIQEIPGNLARLVYPIIVGEVVRGYLSLVAMVGEIDTLDRLVAEQGALVCALEMARYKAVRETEKRLKGDLLTALLQESFSPRDALLWTQSMGLDLNQAHLALRFSWDSEEPPSRRRLETLVNGEVSRLDLKAIVNPIGSEVICICELSRESGRPVKALTFGREVLAQGHAEYPDRPIRCGIGVPVSDISLWRDSFRQAGQALGMAQRVRSVEPLYFPDLSVYRLLLQIEHSPELIAFQEETIGPLLAHEGGDELIRTLEAYFEHNANLSQTSEALFIHRNTLLYRMDRIASILDLDFDNPENRLAVQLALHIYRMKGAARRLAGLEQSDGMTEL